MTTLTLDNGHKLGVDMSVDEIDMSLGRTNGTCIVKDDRSLIINWTHVIYAEEEEEE